jgi:hypothetical protein
MTNGKLSAAEPSYCEWAVGFVAGNFTLPQDGETKERQVYTYRCGPLFAVSYFCIHPTI